jgi:transposase
VKGMVSLKSQYSKEFKIEAVRRVESSGELVLKTASNLGIKPTTLHGWI